MRNQTRGKSGETLVRKHDKPRVEMFVPDDSCPLKQEWLGLYRVTKTSLPADQEKEIRDIWRPDKIQHGFSAPWVGETCFEILRPRAKAGYEWQMGRETKIQKTGRLQSGQKYGNT